MFQGHRDLTRITLGVLFIGAMIATCFLILWPFLPAIIWAITLVLATWQVMLSVQRVLLNSRALAVMVMTLAWILVFILPFWFAIGIIVSHAGQIGDWAREIVSYRVPPAPDWLASLPMVGPRASQMWNDAADMGVRDLTPSLTPYAGRVTNWLVTEVGSLGIVFVQILLTVILTAIIYVNGEKAAALALGFGHRLAGERGRQAMLMAGQAIRGVALAVVVTAVVQSGLGGIAIAVAGVPFASVLTAVIFMLCVAQMGPALVLVPAAIWMFSTGETGWGAFVLACTVLIIAVENLLRPILIRRGAEMPMLLILGGVIGGLIAFGVVGIFLGPAVLAVSYALLQAWMAEDEEAGVPVTAMEPEPERERAAHPAERVDVS
jgi:predicted PurR-regulated permease PerM